MGFSLLPTLLILVFKLALLRRVGPDIYGSDSHFYILQTDLIRQSNRHVLRSCPVFIGSQNFANPFLLQWLASFLSSEHLECWQAYVPIFFKSITTYVLSLTAGVSFYVIYHTGLLEANAAALLAGILYGFSPINRNANPDNLSDFTFSPRSLGTLLASLSCITVVTGIVLNSIVLYVLAIILIALTCLGSKFAIQAVVFILAIIFGILGAWLQVLIVPVGMLVAIIVSKGYYWHVLVQQIRHLKLYATKLARENIPYVRSIFTTLDLPRAVWYLVTGRLRSLYWLIRCDVIFKGMAMYPVHLVCGVILIVYRNFWVENPWLYALAVLWFASLVVFVITSLPWFKFIGEADRYLEFVGFLPATVLVSLWLINPDLSNSTVRLVVLLLLLTWYQLIGEASPPPIQTPSRDRKELWGFLSKLSQQNARAVSIPLNDAPEFIYRTNIPCVWPFPLDASTAHLIYKYPIPLLDFTYLDKHYDINYVVVRKRFLKVHEVQKAVSPLSLVYENAEHQVYKLAGKA